MVKMSVEDLKNIKPSGVLAKLPMEDENGKDTFLEIKVYPLTVEQKLEIQILRDKIKKFRNKKIAELSDDEAEEFGNVLDEIGYLNAYYALKSTVEDINLDFVKKNIANVWIKILNDKVLEAEGLSPGDAKEEKN